MSISSTSYDILCAYCDPIEEKGAMMKYYTGILANGCITYLCALRNSTIHDAN